MIEFSKISSEFLFSKLWSKSVSPVYIIRMIPTEKHLIVCWMFSDHWSFPLLNERNYINRTPTEKWIKEVQIKFMKSLISNYRNEFYDERKTAALDTSNTIFINCFLVGTVFARTQYSCSKIAVDPFVLHHLFLWLIVTMEIVKRWIKFLIQMHDLKIRGCNIMWLDKTAKNSFLNITRFVENWI